LQTDYPDRSERTGDKKADQKAFDKKGYLQSVMNNREIWVKVSYTSSEN
jgi:hypothetical protein